LQGDDQSVQGTVLWIMKFVLLQVTCYRAVPLRILSRVWGWLLSKQLPPLIRPLVYNYYASTYNCNLEEAAHEDLTVYKSLAEFFCRPLKDGVRPVNKVDCIVSNLMSVLWIMQVGDWIS